MATLYPIHRKVALISLSILILTFSILFSYFYLYQPVFEELFSQYLNRQLRPTLLGQREQAGNAWDSIIEVFKQMILPVVVFIVLRFKSGSSYSLQRGSVFFFLIALCGTLPFLFMDRQHHYYFMPSMAFWMLGFGIHLAQNPYPWSIKRTKWVKFISISNLGIWFLAVGLSIYFSKSPSRDKHIVKAIEHIEQSYRPLNVHIDDLTSNWKLVAITERYAEFYLTENECDWLISNNQRSIEGEILVERFDKADLFLYKKATNSQ